MKSGLCVCILCTSALHAVVAFADHSNLEVGAVYRSANASSLSLQVLGPTLFFGFKPGIEVGTKRFQTLDNAGVPTTQNASELALTLAAREQIAGRFNYNGTIILGLTNRIEGRKAQEAATTKRTENVVFSDFRFGVGTAEENSGIVTESGVTMRINYIDGDSTLLVNGVTPIAFEEPGVYVKLGYRF